MDELGLVPRIVLRGSAEERGLSHGKQLRDRVHATWAWYMKHFKSQSGGAVTEARLKEFGEHFAAVIRAFEPEYCIEIEGIASGSGIEPWKVYCINSRTEIMYTLRREARNATAQAPAGAAEHGTGKVAVAAPAGADDAPTECTSVFCSEYGVLAQNWDWNSSLEPLIVLLDVVREDGHAFATICEPGMLGKLGLNSAGVGCLLNAMDCGQHLDEAGMPTLEGVPIHVLLRATLDAPSVAAALARLTAASGGGPELNTSSHIFVGSANGESALVEYAGKTGVDADVSDACADADAQLAFRLHTNHYLKCGLAEHGVHGFPEGAQMTSSRSRYKRAAELIQETPPLGSTGEAVERAKAILGDTKGYDGNGTFPICMPFTSKSLGAGLAPSLGKSGTVATAVMDLGAGTMHYTRGSPLHHGYSSFTITA